MEWWYRVERVDRERWDSNPGTTHDAPRVCDSVTLLNCKRPSGSHAGPLLGELTLKRTPILPTGNGILAFYVLLQTISKR